MFVLCPRDMVGIKIRKYKKLPKTGVKIKNRPGFPVHMRSKYDVKISDRLSQNWAGLRRIAFFCSLSLDIYGIHFCNNLSSYLMGGEFGNEAFIDIFSVYTTADG